MKPEQQWTYEVTCVTLPFFGLSLFPQMKSGGGHGRSGPLVKTVLFNFIIQLHSAEYSHQTCNQVLTVPVQLQVKVVVVQGHVTVSHVQFGIIL